jgi:hypothetical protein
MLRSGGRLVAYGGTPTTDLGDWLMMFTLNLVPDKREFIFYSILLQYTNAKEVKTSLVP